MPNENKTEKVTCQCDFDNWQPEPNGNGHTWVCPIYKAWKAEQSNNEK